MIEIKEESVKPDGIRYRRSGEGDYHCTKSEVRAMLRDQTEDTSDMKVLENFEINDLNMDTVHAYRNRHTASETKF